MSMNEQTSRYVHLVDEQLKHRVESCKGLVPEHLLEVLRGYLTTGGKRLRPALLMLSCEAFGGKPEDVVCAAAAVEMYHNWTLIHDDVIDRDPLRRGRPTGHIVGTQEGKSAFGLSDLEADCYGQSVAILAGDLLQGLAVEMLGSLAESYPAVVPIMMSRMSGRLGRELIGGEQLDVELSHMPFAKVTEALVLLMMTGKTGALFRYTTECGTALGLNTVADERVSAMGRFGNLMGLSFQLQDDLLGIYGTEAKLGKPIGSDIREGKRTLLAVRTLNGLAGARRERFLQLYGNDHQVGQEEIEEVRALMTESGATESVRKSAAKLTDEAEAVLSGIMPTSAASKQMRELTLSMLKRQS